MNKIIKMLMSGFTALSMVMVSQGIIRVSADDPVPSPAPSIERTLSVKFMGRGDTPQDVSPGKAQLNAEDKTNQTEFWVGVSVDKVQDLPLFTNGAYSLEVAFEYDPDFIVPYYTSNDAEGDWKSALEKGNLGAENNTAWWNSGQYEVLSVVDTDIDIETDYGVAVDREAADVAQQRKDDGWRMCVVCINFKGGAFDNTRFKNLTNDDTGEQYLVKLPFKVINVPADTATDKDPTVLSLVRGPETFNMGAGADGKSPHSTWEATVTDWSDAENMKTLFRDSGDISLFGTGGSIENIEPFKPKTGEETADTKYILSNTDALEEDGFSAEQKTYFLRVPNEVEKIKLNITASDNPEVKIAYSDTTGETTINSASSGEKQFTTDEIVLKELNKDTDNGGMANGYNNTVTVSSGDTTYTIYIQRLLKPKIVLNPGNSPYGEMERMAAKYLPADKQDQAWDEAKIQKAKEEFNKNNQYTADYLPINVSDKMPVIYTLEAWGGLTDSSTNMDRNDYAIFAYENTPFVDTGFTAIDAFGDVIDNSQVVRSIEVIRLTGFDISEEITDSNKDLMTISADSNNLEDIVAQSKRLVRPGVYELCYALINDPTTVLQKRKIIILPLLGDIDLQDGVNNNDTVPIVSQVQRITNIIDRTKVEDSIADLFLYRVCDTDYQDGVNNNDTVPIVSQVQRVSEIINFYKSTE